VAQGQKESWRKITVFEELRPGDLIFYARDAEKSSTIYHVAVYIGNNQMLHAPRTGEVVKIGSFNKFPNGFIHARRPFDENGNFIA